MSSLGIIDTQVGNMASLQIAFQRIGLNAQLISDPNSVLDHERVVLPGVGRFSAGMKRLNELGLIDAIRSRVEQGAPLLAVCLGLQLLAQRSEESEGIAGLKVLPNDIVRLPNDVKIPQLGWNQVVPELPSDIDTGLPQDFEMISKGVAYFANSYCLSQPPPGWRFATTHYGMNFVSAIWKEKILACQFHPELSGTWGLELLERWAFGRSKLNLNRSGGASC